MSVDNQIIILYAALNGYLDDVAVDKVSSFETGLHRFMEANHPEVGSAVAREKALSPETEESLKAAIQEFKQTQFIG